MNNKNEKALVFYKVRPEVITPDNIHTNVCMSSLVDSPVSALYHSVHQLYVPLLLKDEKVSKTLDPKLQNLLGELEAGLGSTIRKKDGGGRGRQVDEESFGGIYFTFCFSLEINAQIV